MIRFTNDYSEGCHPSILEAMAATNTAGNPGYSTDPHSARAPRLTQAATRPPGAGAKAPGPPRAGGRAGSRAGGSTPAPPL